MCVAEHDGDDDDATGVWLERELSQKWEENAVDEYAGGAGDGSWDGEMVC